MTAERGLGFAYHDGNEAGFYELIESVGGGGAAIDFDRDGRPDLFLNGGGRLSGPPIEVRGLPSSLHHNEPGGSFVDVTALAGLDSDDLYTHGCTAADLDADGFTDLIVAGYAGWRVHLNEGDGTFSESAVPAASRWNVTPAAADVDRDGLVDVYLMSYAEWRPDGGRRCANDKGLRDICGPTLFPGQRDQLWRNAGDGTFDDVADAYGLVDGNRGLGLVACDFDENGWIDFAVVNDVEENQLYLNDGSGAFREEGVLAGIAYSDTGDREGSMGVDAGDFDGDLKPDLWYANYAQQDNSLLRNTGEAGFVHVGRTTGHSGPSRPWVGFGTNFADFDGDGWEDLYVLNGHVAYDRRDSPYFQPAQLFRNEAGERFDEVSDEAGPYFSVPHAGRGGIVADFDDDGGLDLAIVHQNDPVTLLRNRRPAEHWIAFDPVGTTVDRDAVGVKVVVESGGRPRARWRLGGGGYLSYRDRRIWFALDSGEPVEAVVRWPGGRTEVFSELEPGATHVLVEGRGRADAG